MRPNKKPNKKLSDKFCSSFYSPFLAGSLLLMIAVIFAFPFSNNYINNKDSIKSLMMEKEFKKSLPLILSGIYSINNIFQLYINNLIKIQSYYKYNSNRTIAQTNISSKNKIINKFSFNGVNNTQINKFLNLYKKYDSNKEYLLNQVRWFINPNITDLNDENNDTLIINQLYGTINLLPLLKTVLKLTDVYYTESDTTNQIYMMFSNSELFIKYPIVYNNIFGQDFLRINNPSNCKNKLGKFPEYYYFKCRPYYSYLLKEVKKGYNISISNVYKFLNGNYGLTICIQFQDVIDENEVITLCHDIDMNFINSKLDSINNNIPGYIFLMKTGSEVPIYYPVEFKDTEYINLANMEFSIKDEFYNDEISLFTKSMPKLIDEYKYSNDTIKNMTSFDISKNNEKYNYTLFPIFFEIPDNPNLLPVHLLTLVYVNPYDKKFEINFIYSTILIIVIFLLMECLLLLLCKYLINSIAKNIVMPIKIIKDLLEQDFDIISNDEIDDRNIFDNNNYSSVAVNNNPKLNNQKTNSEKNMTGPNPQSSKNENIELKKNSNLVQENFYANNFMKESNRDNLKNSIESRNSNLKLKFEDDESSSEEDDSSFENEDDIDKTKYRSDNIQQLFMKLVDLKNAFKCVEDNKLSDEKLTNLVYSQNVFYDINNLEASSLCESNISSLFVKAEQFDKAISHLYDGIEDINKKIFRKSYGKNKINKLKMDEIKKKIKSENLLNRYIKLFYCYKQYFKHVKRKLKLLKSKFNKNKEKEIFNPDINSFYITHHITKYKKCLDEYITRVKEYFGGKDLYIGYLEKLEEKISFELSFIKDINKGKEKNNIYNSIKSEQNSNENKNDKESVIKEILDLFKETDKLNISEQIFISNYNYGHLINLLKYDSDIVNAMDVPLSILTQRTNFLKGKFHLKCYDYKQAIEYFESALNYEKIGDIEIKINSLRYLIKISNIYLNLVDKDIKLHSLDIEKHKKDLDEDKERKKTLIKYIKNLSKEIESYKYIPKDICIILNLGNLSDNNNLNIRENFSNIQKIVKYIYENIVTNKDRIAILEYKKNNYYRFLLPLQIKDDKNEKNISEVIENIEPFLHGAINKIIKHHNYTQSNLFNLINDNKKNKFTNEQPPPKKKNSLIMMYIQKEKENSFIHKNSDCLFDSVNYCNGYLKIKQNNYEENNNSVENWMIFITCEFNEIEINEIISKSLNSRIFMDERKNDNLIIIFYESVNDVSKQKIKKWLNFNKSDVLLRDQLDKLKSIMGSIGEKHKTHFELEKYKDKF